VLYSLLSGSTGSPATDESSATESSATESGATESSATESSATESSATESSATESAATECQYTVIEEGVASSTAAAAQPGSTSAPAPAKPCPCILVQELYRIKVEVISVQYQVTFQILIDEIEGILELNISIKVKMVKIGQCMEEFLLAYPAIAKQCRNEQIETWGPLDMLITTSILIQAEMQYNQLNVINVTTGECWLTRSIKTQCANNKCGGPGSSFAINQFVTTVQSVCLRWYYAGYDKQRLFAWLAVFLDIFFDQQPKYKDGLKSVNMTNGITIGEFYPLCLNYRGTFSILSGVYTNYTKARCPFAISLQVGLNKAVQSASPPSPAVKSECQSYINKIDQNFTTYIGPFKRSLLVTYSYYKLSKGAQEVFNQCPIVNSSYLSINLTISVVVAMGCSCENQERACGNITQGGGGESYLESVKPDKNPNKQRCSTMLISLKNFQNGLNTTVEKNAFQTYYNGAFNCITNATYNKGNLKIALNCTYVIINKYSTQTDTASVQRRNKLQATVIPSICDGNNGYAGMPAWHTPSSDDRDADKNGLGSVGDDCYCKTYNPKYKRY